MARRSNSYAQIINDAKVMPAGLTANAERMAKRGITAEFIAKLQSVYEEVGTSPPPFHRVRLPSGEGPYFSLMGVESYNEYLSVFSGTSYLFNGSTPNFGSVNRNL